MASRRGWRLVSGARTPEGRDRWRRWVLVGQGVYYLLIGLWPLLHFSSFARIIALHINPFQSQAFAAVMIVVGGSLIEAARREPPGSFPTLLGAAVAGAIAVVSLIWLPRTGGGDGLWFLGGASGLWVDLLIEAAIAVALVLLYPRAEPERGRTTRRRDKR